MKKNILFTIILVVSFTYANATVWRLNNLPGTNAHFTTIQAAHNSPLVLDGDTLYLEASSGTYGDLVSTKKLIIIGNGYFTAENLGNQANIAPSRITDITYNNGSQGSIITGCQIRHVIVNTSEITIERNYIVSNENNNHLIRLNSSDLNNIIIQNNFLENINGYTSHYGSDRYAYCITALQNGLNNIFIKSNYLFVIGLNDYKVCLNLGNGFSGTISNNLIRGNNTIHNSIFINNILREGSFTAANTTILHNLGNSTQFGTFDGNQSNVNMANVFVGTGSTDGQWQLKEGSPAIGAGVGGVDCGMFGGSEPYILSGIPAIPAVYKFDMDVNNVEQKIDVEMSVKTRN